MKKTYLILCILGIALPYYNLFNFLKINNWSMDGFFSLLYENYAVSMLSMDLTVAADLVSKTLGSSTNAMSRYGIQVTGAVGSTERLESLTNNLANVFGGQASAQAETMSGKLDQMKNAAGDTAEAIGDLLSPVVTNEQIIKKLEPKKEIKQKIDTLLADYQPLIAAEEAVFEETE